MEHSLSPIQVKSNYKQQQNYQHGNLYQNKKAYDDEARYNYFYYYDGNNTRNNKNYYNNSLNKSDNKNYRKNVKAENYHSSNKSLQIDDSRNSRRSNITCQPSVDHLFFSPVLPHKTHSRRNSLRNQQFTEAQHQHYLNQQQNRHNKQQMLSQQQMLTQQKFSSLPYNAQKPQRLSQHKIFSPQKTFPSQQQTYSPQHPTFSPQQHSFSPQNHLLSPSTTRSQHRKHTETLHQLQQHNKTENFSIHNNIQQHKTPQNAVDKTQHQKTRSTSPKKIPSQHRRSSKTPTELKITFDFFTDNPQKV